MKVKKILINNDDFFYEDDIVIVAEGLHKAESVIGKVIYFSENTTYTGRIYNIDPVQNEIVLDISDKYRTKTKTISVENIIDIKKIA